MKRLVPIAIALSLTILLASIVMAQGLANAHLSEAPDGSAMTQFPSGTAVVYAIFDYADMVGESIKVRVYDNYGSILFEQIQNYTGSGTESVATAPSEGVFPDGRYVTNFYRGEYASRTILWDVGEPVARPTAEPTPSPVVKIYNHKGDELCTQLNTHLRQALEAGYEMQEFGERLLTVLDPEKAEEVAPQLLNELSQLETKLDLAQGDIDSALAIINEAKGLSLPEWYGDYFAKKEEVVNHLSAAFGAAEQLLPRLVPLLETMPGVYRTIEEGTPALQEIQRAVASMSVVGFKEWAQLRQKMSEFEQIVSAEKTELNRAYAKLPVPIFKSSSELLVLALQASGLLKQAIDAREAGDVDRARTLAIQAKDKLQAAPFPETEETMTWFMEEYGSPVEEFQRHLEQAATANDQAEMAFGKMEPMPTPVAVPTGIEVTGSDWLDAIPLPTEVSTEPEVVGTNLGLALFFTLAFGLTSALLNATLAQNEELIHARLAPLLAPLRRAAERLPRPAEGPRIRIGKPILLLLFSALLYAFLDPGFGISASGAIILLSLFVALAVLVYSYEGTQALLGARFYKLRARFQLFPIALAFGVACVLLTRWMDFHPGYLYGFVAGFAFLGMEAETPRRWALLVLAGAGALLAASLAAWGLAVPVSRLAEGGLPGASVLYGVLVAIFVAGLEGLLFTLVPLTFMDGSKVMAWSRAVWGVAFGLAAWLFFHVLINPGSAYLEALTSKKVVLMLGTLAAYGFLTVATWLFFRWYAGRRAAPRAPVEVEEPTPPPEGEAAIEPAVPPPAAPPRPELVAPVRPEGPEERVYRWRPKSWLRRLVLAMGALVWFFFFSNYTAQMQAAAVVPRTLGDWLTMLYFVFVIPAIMMFQGLRPTSMREVVISPEKGVIFRRKSGKEKPVIADVTRVRGPGWSVLSASALVIEGRSPKGKKVRGRVARSNLEPGKFQGFVEDVRRLAPPAEAVKAKGRLRRVCAWVTNFLAGACLVFFVGIAWRTGRDYAKGIPSYALGEEIRVGLIFLLVTLAMALLSILLAERKMLVAGIWSVAIGLAIVAGAVIAGPELRGELPKLALPQVELPFGVAKAPPAEMPAPTFTTFRGDIFSFEYPSSWKRISEGEADAARKMLSLGGAAKYVDGVYTGGLFTGRGLGLIVVMVIEDPRLPGTLTDAHFSQLKAAYEREMGSGLLSMEEAQMGSMSGVELELLQSGMRIWLLLVFSGEEGRAYEFGCAASEGSFDDHLPVFERARSTLRIAAPTPVAPTPPTPTAPATPSPTVPAPMPPSEVITYTIQAGDTLSGIAAEFGVTVDAIAEANDIEDPSLIRVGQVLVIPGPGPRE